MATDTIDETQVEAYFAGLDAKFNAMTFNGPLSQIISMASDGMTGFIFNSLAPDGQPYKPLKRPRPKGHNPGTKPLIDTGALIQSLRGGTDHVQKIDSFEAMVGTSHWKAGFHEFGTKHIPARPFIGIDEGTQEQAPELLGDYIMREMGG